MFHRKSALPGVLVLTFLLLPASSAQERERSSLPGLLPRISGWDFSEPPRTYDPPTLFEYINGAAENYLSYAFQELLVANYKRAEGAAALTLEIYEMGSDRNAFGIYSAERFPESRFLPLGNEAYYESGTLNFVVGSIYVKLLCYDCGEGDETVLRQFAGEVEARVDHKGRLPALLRLFPREGLVAHSEKFILHNVLGFAFLHDGLIAGYKTQDQEFELLIIEGRDAAEAEDMLRRYLEVQEKNGQAHRTVPGGVHFKDRYAQNIYLARTGNLILGVMRIRDGAEETGLRSLQALLDAARR